MQLKNLKAMEPLKDVMAKILLVKNEDILQDVISSIIQRKIKIIQKIAEVSWIGDRPKEKIMRSDMLVETEEEWIILEFQKYEDDDYETRLAGYVAKVITMQLESGKGYKEFKKIIVISISEKTMIEMPEFYGRTVRVIDKYREIPALNTVEHYILDLEKYQELKEIEIDNPIHQWAEFFRYEREEELAMIAERNEKVEKALEEMERLTADKETWIQVERIREARLHQRLAIGSAEARGKAIGEEIGEARGEARGERNGIRMGKELGKTETIKETIKNMIKEGIKDDLIVKVTGVSKKELEKQKALIGA